MPSRSVRIKHWLWKKEHHPEQIKAGHVYIVKLSRDVYKVGRTTDLARRLSSFRTSNIGADFVWSAYVLDMVEGESMLHHVFRDKKLEREMFSLYPSDVRQAERIIKYLSVPDEKII